jgi:hypothetical protein
MRTWRIAILASVAAVVLVTSSAAQANAYVTYQTEFPVPSPYWYAGYSHSDYADGIGICFEPNEYIADDQLFRFGYNLMQGIRDTWGDAIQLTGRRGPQVINLGPCLGSRGQELEIRWDDLGTCSLNQSAPPLARTVYDAAEIGGPYPDDRNVVIYVNQQCVEAPNNRTFFWWMANHRGELGIPDNRYDLRTIIAREFGHALGLSYSNVGPYGQDNGFKDLMDSPAHNDDAYCSFRGNRVSRIGWDDALGVRSLPGYDDTPEVWAGGVLCQK